MKKTFYILFFFMGFSFVSGQKIYKPIDTLAVVQKQNFLNGFSHRYKLKLKEVSRQYKGSKKKKLKELYTGQYGRLSKSFSGNDLYFYQPANEYLKHILKQISKDNPGLIDDNLEIYFSRDPSPNAFSVGDGLIIVNLDLLNYLENEAELAFVIAHEIAHYQLKHREKSYENYVNRILSEDFKKKSKEVFKSKYGRQERAKKLLTSFVYSRRHRSRQDELEADSLGYIYILHSAYPTDEVIPALRVLDSVDVETDSLSKDFLKKLFSTPSQKFNPEWFYVEDLSAYKYTNDEQSKDSLKTHPDITERIKQIQKIAQSKLPKEKTGNFAVDSTTFKQLKQRAAYESIVNMYLKKDYGFGLYQTTKRLQKNPEDRFLLKMFYLFLNQLKEAKKTMTFNRYVPQVNLKKHSKSQQLFINFLYNMHTGEMERILKDYKQQLEKQTIKIQLL